MDNLAEKNCRYCGKPMPTKEVICKFCGYNTETGTLTASGKQQSSQEPGKAEVAKKRKPNIIQFIFAAIILFASVSFLIYTLFTGKVDIKGFVSKIAQGLNKLKPAEKKAQSGYPGKKAAGPAGSKKAAAAEKAQTERRKNFLVLEGIAFDSNTRSFATISGEVFCEGDSTANFKVKKINENSVELIVDGEVKTLEIGQSIPLSIKDKIKGILK